MGSTELLTIVFIVLKLIGTIEWSWWLVLLPEIIAIGFYIAILTVRLVLYSLSVRSTNRAIARLVEKDRKYSNRF